MIPEFSDELISAYLDGELTADEQARVENALLDSAEHRRTFEELRALRRSLQSLPVERLDEGFAERVLRRAEREMLAPRATSRDDEERQPAAPDEGASAERKVVPLSSAASPSTVQHGVPIRRWVALVTAGALAASLLIAVLVVPRWLQPEVARGPEPVPGSDSSSSPEGKLAGPVENNTVDTKAQAGGESQGKSAAARSFTSQNLKDGGTKSLQYGSTVGGAISDNASALQPEESADRRQGDLYERGREGTGGGRSVGRGGYAGGFGGAGAAKDGGAAGPSRSAAARYAPQDALRLESAEFSPPGRAFDAQPQQQGGTETTDGIPRRSLLVVTVDVTSAAYESGAFDELLSTNSIVMEQTAPDAQLAVRERGREETVRDRAATANGEATRQIVEADAARVSPDDAREPLVQFEREAVRAYDVEMVEVDAPPELVQAAIDDLRRQPDTFQNVELRSANEREISLLLAASTTDQGDYTDKQRGFAENESAEAPPVDGAHSPLGDSPTPRANAPAAPASSAFESAPAPRTRIAQSGGGGRGVRDDAPAETADAPQLAAEEQREFRSDGDRRGGEQESLKKEQDEEQGGANALDDQTLGDKAATTGSARGTTGEPLQKGRARRLSQVRVLQRIDDAYRNQNVQSDEDQDRQALPANGRPVAGPEADGAASPRPLTTPADEERGDTRRRKSDEPRDEKAFAEDNVSPSQPRADADSPAGGKRIEDARPELESAAPQRLNVLFVIRIQRPGHGLGAAREASQEAAGAASNAAPASEAPQGDQQP